MSCNDMEFFVPGEATLNEWGGLVGSYGKPTCVPRQKTS